MLFLLHSNKFIRVEYANTILCTRKIGSQIWIVRNTLVEGEGGGRWGKIEGAMCNDREIMVHLPKKTSIGIFKQNEKRLIFFWNK